MTETESVSSGRRRRSPGDCSRTSRRSSTGRPTRSGSILAALVCDGHVLLEDVPGTAKTVLARAIAGSVEGASFARIQCTPDLQPTDVTGLSVFNQRDRDFEFRPGPVFANVLLVDEINRAMPKTQSALLEAMAEYQATIDGVTRSFRSRSWCSPRRTRSSRRGRSRCRRLSSTASCSARRSATRARKRNCGSSKSRSLTSAQRTAAGAVARRGQHAARSDPQRVHRPAAATLGDQARARDAGGRGRGDRRLRPRLARPRALGACVGAPLRPEFVSPVDIERLFLPVVMHRIVFTPSYVATAREIGWQEAADGFQRQCLEIAPAARSRARAGRFRMKLLALAGLGLALAGGVAAASSQADPVTMSMRHTRTCEQGARPGVVTARWRAAPPGEDVELPGAECLDRATACWATQTHRQRGRLAERTACRRGRSCGLENQVRERGSRHAGRTL